VGVFSFFFENQISRL